MSKAIKITKGLNINLMGEAEKIISNAAHPSIVAIKPSDFEGLTPKLVVKQGDEVLAGSPLFIDKDRPEISIPSPVSGEVAEIVRGEKRRILEIRIVADSEIKYREFGNKDVAALSKEDVKKTLLDSGVWSFLQQRPFGIIANPKDEPKAIFVSGLETNPLAADVDFSLKGREADLQVGIDVLAKLTAGKVHLTLNNAPGHGHVFQDVKNPQLQVNTINGLHPAGNVGVQIHHIDPINKGEVVWTINPRDLAIVGALFAKGKYDATRIVAVGGEGVKSPKYIRTILGAKISSIVEGNLKSDLNYRLISGTVLTGTKTSTESFLGSFDASVVSIPEGDEPKFFVTDGWASPGFNKFSFSRSFPTWLASSKKKYSLDTSLNGEERAFVVTGQYEKVFPFNIYPLQLIKAIMANDIELMENLGVYEIAPEDFSLCEFICTSKVDVQDIVQNGLSNLRSELGL